MKIGILISNKSLEQYTNIESLEKAANNNACKLVRLYESRLLFNKNCVQENGDQIDDIDIIIPRSNFTEEPSLHSHVPKLLKNAGFKILNSQHDYAWSKNKLVQAVLFNEFNIPTPNWYITKSPKEALNAANIIKFPVIIKVAFGTLGKGVFYTPDSESLLSIADYLSVRDGNPMIVQEYISEANQQDIRVFIIGGKIVASMKRTACKGDVRANTSNGGTGSIIKLTEEETKLATRTAKIFKLDIAGIDIIRSNNGPLILEVNSNPGFKELQRITDIDIADLIIKFAINSVVEAKK